MKNAALCMLGFFLLFACEKQIDVKFPFEGERFFIFGTLSNNEIVEVKVDKTYPPNGKILFDNTFLEGVEVDLFQDGHFLERLKQRPADKHSFYSEAGNRAIAGHVYQIRAAGGGLPEAVSNEEVLLKSVRIESIQEDEEMVSSPLNPQILARSINISVSDIPEEVPYLLFEIIAFSDRGATSANVISAEEYEELENPCMYPNSSGIIFFKADCYDANETTFKFYIESEGTYRFPADYQSTGYDPADYTMDKVKYIEVKLSAVNKSYFDYNHDLNEPLNFFSVFEGVNPTYTTFKNGYGAILSKNTNTKTFRFSNN